MTLALNSKADGSAELLVNGNKALTFDDKGVVGGALPFSFRNRIINGDMRIDQRVQGTDLLFINNTGTTLWALDRFSVANTTTTGVTHAQQSTLNGKKSYKLIATSPISNLSTSRYFSGVNQIVEANNSIDLNGNSIVISFLVETNWSGNLAIAVRDGTATRSYVTDAPVISGVNKVAVTLPLESNTVKTPMNGAGFIISIGFCNESSFVTPTRDAWVSGNYVTSSNATQWVKTTGNFINVTELQVEKGSIPTEFEQRPYGLELNLCQRYTYAFTGGGASDLVGAQISTTGAAFFMRFPTQLRSTPTFSHNASGFGAGTTQVGGFNLSAGVAMTASALTLSMIQTSANTTRLNLDSLTNGTAGHAVTLNIGTGVTFVWSAEL